MRHFIDLSVPLENDVKADPTGMGPHIDYISHVETLDKLIDFFPGLRADEMPDGSAWAHEKVALTTHNGTHVDAPWHYAATMDGGTPSMRIDEVPLEWCFQPGVKLDFRSFPDGYVATPEDIDRELMRIGHKVRPLEIVLINTRAGERYGFNDYVDSGCGMGRAATLHLTSMGTRVVGTDGWSWDAPFSHTARRYAETRDASLIWEGHKAGLETVYCQIEKLTNLDALPPTGFMVACFPCKVKGASGGWTRAVAIFD